MEQEGVVVIMHRSKRNLSLVLSTLVVIFASVFLMGTKANAQTVVNDGTLPVKIDVLKENEPKIELRATLVEERVNELQQETQTIKEIERKRETLIQEVERLKQELEDMKKKIAEKKARLEAERKRVAELRSLFVRIDRYAPDAAGNVYAWGNCTVYVKGKRPDASNSWGNANTWYSRAQAQGWNVGTLPKKGAIATSTKGFYGHVAYVEGMTPDRQWVTVSEMNYQVLNKVTYRTVHYSTFKYIYELN